MNEAIARVEGKITDQFTGNAKTALPARNAPLLGGIIHSWPAHYAILAAPYQQAPFPAVVHNAVPECL
jgi:hypothetical protein